MKLYPNRCRNAVFSIASHAFVRKVKLKMVLLEKKFNLPKGERKAVRSFLTDKQVRSVMILTDISEADHAIIDVFLPRIWKNSEKYLIKGSMPN